MVFPKEAVKERDMLSGYVRTTEAAERLGGSPRTITRWVKSGRFPNAFKVYPDADNSPYMIPVSDIEAIEGKRSGSSNGKEHPLPD